MWMRLLIQQVKFETNKISHQISFNEVFISQLSQVKHFRFGIFFIIFEILSL